jgi:D-tyrosyl-tRNA(Tyr) deacylase
VVAEIGPGLCVLLGVAQADDEAVAERLAERVARLRVFENEAGRFDRSLLDTGGQALVVSQFTLIADYRSQEGTVPPKLVPGWSGNRPSFTHAARPEQAQALYLRFCQTLRDLGVPVQTGVFGARMSLELVNDGPVTLILDM